MNFESLVLLLTIASLALIPKSKSLMKTWTFELVSIETKVESDNLEIQVEVERVSRDVFALSGMVDVKVDAYNDAMIEVHIYRSATGSNDYKKTPFALSKQPLEQLMNGIYKNMLMSSLPNCSNAPQFEKFTPPLPKGVYYLNRCQIDNDAMPAYVSEGYYRVDVFGRGQFEFLVQVLVKVEKIIF